MASTVWRGYITFGLISIPVRLFRAARAERVSFRRMYRAAPSASEPAEIEPNEDEHDDRPAAAPRPAAQSGPRLEVARNIRQPEPAAVPETLVPLQQISVRKGTGEAVSPQKVVKGYEYEKNRFVAIEPEELKNIAPKTATQMEIAEFVELAGIDPVYFETSYYVVPEEAGQKAYALLYKALGTAGLVAVAQFAMHGREHVVIVRPSRKGLIAHTMFFSSEVRADEEYRADVDSVSAKELDLAEKLIHSLSAPFEPEKYRDTYREKIEEIIARKVAGQPVETEEKPLRQAAVVDITEALQRSLAALKKPAAKEEKPPAEPKTERTAKKSIRKTAGR
jgi:DNA end-binding protein Ku